MLREFLDTQYKNTENTMLDLVIAETEYIHKCTGMTVELLDCTESRDSFMVLLGDNRQVISLVETTRDPIDDLDRLKGLWFYLWQTTSGKDVSA